MTEAPALDISSEEYRIYSYADGSVRIDEPKLLFVTASGSHRVVDAQGVTHRPTPGWLLLSWKPREGQPAFVA